MVATIPRGVSPQDRKQADYQDSVAVVLCSAAWHVQDEEKKRAKLEESIDKMRQRPKQDEEPWLM